MSCLGEPGDVRCDVVIQKYRMIAPVSFVLTGDLKSVISPKQGKFLISPSFETMLIITPRQSWYYKLIP